jgi:hypothetical protein
MVRLHSPQVFDFGLSDEDMKMKFWIQCLDSMEVDFVRRWDARKLTVPVF